MHPSAQSGSHIPNLGSNPLGQFSRHCYPNRFVELEHKVQRDSSCAHLTQGSLHGTHNSPFCTDI